MLTSNDKTKLDKYVKNIINEIYKSSKSKINVNLSLEEAVATVNDIVANRVKNESKVLVTSVFNMAKENTLAKPLYENTRNKSKFYELDILTELVNQCKFDVSNPHKFLSMDNKNKSFFEGVSDLFFKKDNSQEIDQFLSQYLSSLEKEMLNFTKEIDKAYNQKIRGLEFDLTTE